MSGDMLGAVLLLLGIAVVSTLAVFLAPILLVVGAIVLPIVLTWWAVRLSRRVELKTIYRRAQDTDAEAIRNGAIARHYADHYYALMAPTREAGNAALAAKNIDEARAKFAEAEQCYELWQRYSDWSTYYAYQRRDIWQGASAAIENAQRAHG
jgi:hypothetical protein